MGSPVIFNGSRSKLLTSAGLLTQAGRTLDYDGTINYIANNGFEINATGYAAFADAAQTSPTDGTGGSPNVTIARSTSSPLVQSASGLFTKDAANRQGQGFSYDFTIDSAYQAKVLSIGFAYAIGSGTYADGDMSVWIYDVTNAVVIQPSGYSILNVTGTATQVAEFQSASNSTSYRLIFFCGSTSASAYTVKFDQISVSPVSYNQGAYISDWTENLSLTPSGFGTISTTKYFSRRVGSNLEMFGYFTMGTTTGTPNLGLPASIRIDSTKMGSAVSTQRVGTSHSLPPNASSATCFATKVSQELFYDGSDTATIYLANGVGNNVDRRYDKSTAANIAPSASGDVYNYWFSIPVAGWGVTQVLSSDTATNVVSAQYKMSGNFSATAGAVIKYNSQISDSNGAYSTSTGLYTVPVPGTYRISVCTLASGAAGAVYAVKNGTASSFITQAITTNVSGGSVTLNCSAGDTIAVYSDTTNTHVATSGGIVSSLLCIDRIAGPAQIAGSESVNARYFASSTSITGSLATISWTTKDFDSDNML